MNDLLEILENLHPDVDFTMCTGLIEQGILDSFDLVTIISEVVDIFDVVITADEIIPENFDSAETIYALIESKMDEEDE